MKKLFLDPNHVIYEDDLGNEHPYAKDSDYDEVNGGFILKERFGRGATLNIPDPTLFFDKTGTVAFTAETMRQFLKDNTGGSLSLGAGTLSVNVERNALGYDAWGRAKTITDKSLFSGLFTFNIPFDTWYERLNTSVLSSFLYCQSVNGALAVGTADVLNSVTSLRTFRNLRYQANRGHLYSTSSIISNPTGLMRRDFGIGTEENAVFFRLKSGGTLVGVIRTTRDSVQFETEVPLTIPNGVDLSKGNVFDIQFQWRGVGDYKFFINLQEVGNSNTLGNLTELSMANPSLPVFFESENLGDDDVMTFGCVDVTSEGGEDPKGSYGSVSMDNIAGQVAVSGYNQPVIAVRSKLAVGGKINTRDTLALLVSAYSDNKSLMRVWATRDFTAITNGTQSWQDFGDGHLEYMIVNPDAGTPMTFDTSKAFPSIFGARVGQDTSYSSSALFEGRTNVYQTPGDMFIFTVHRENGGDCKVGVTYEFAEEI